MRLTALLTLITACSASHATVTASGGAEIGEAGAQSVVTHGGREPLASGGSSNGGQAIVTAGEAGAQSVVTGAGGEPQLPGSAGMQAGGASDGGAAPIIGGGATTGEAGQGGASVDAVQPWKICQDGQICGDDEVCVYDTLTHRICTKQDDSFHRCVNETAPSTITERCAALGAPCQHTWSRCNRMSINAAGDSCGPVMFDPPDGGERWNCGPPAL